VAEINDIDLKLNILATDEASEVLKALSGVLDDLKENLAAFADLNPFADLQDIADSLASAIKDLNDGITNLKETFSELDTTGLPTLIDQMSQINEQGATLRSTLTGVQDEIEGMVSEGRDNPLTAWNETANELRSVLTGVLDETSNVDDTAKSDPFSGWSAAVQGVKEQLDGVVSDLRLIAELSQSSFKTPSVSGGSKKGGVTPVSESQMLDWFSNIDQSELTPEQRAEYARAAVNNDVPSFYNQYGKELGAPQPTVAPPAEPAPETGGFKIPSLTDTIGGINSFINELPSKLMTYGMTGLMGYYGIQGLANSENQFANIQQMMNLNNQTVNEAAQSSVMLGTVGLSGTAGEAIGEGALAAGALETGAGEAAGEGLGIMAGGEALGLGLDATGVLAPLGIAIGALAPVVAYAVSNWNSIGPALSKAGSDVGNWAVKTGGEIGSWASTHTKDLGDWAQKTGDNIGSWVTTHTQDISNWATKTGGNISDWVSTHTTDILNWANTTGANVSNWASTHTDDLISWADQTGANIGYWASTHTADIGNWADTTGSQIGDWTLTHTQDIENWATTTGNSISGWYNSTVSVIGNWVKQVAGDFGVTLSNIGNDIGQGVNSVVNWMSQAASNISNTVGSLFGGGNVSGNALSWIQTAMADTGVSGSNWTNLLAQLVQAESGGNPNAINSTTVDGEHAEGIAQMLPSTFAAHMMQGMSDIFNPIDNLVSSIRYILGRYGSPENLISLTGLGTGNYKGYANGGILDEPIVGIGLSTGTHYSFAETGPEAIVPMSGGRSGGGGGLALASGGGGANVNQFYVNITVPTSARDVKTMAQQVATEFVNQLKRRGNFDFGG
jgi:hypothetical protein